MRLSSLTRDRLKALGVFFIMAGVIAWLASCAPAATTSISATAYSQLVDPARGRDGTHLVEAVRMYDGVAGWANQKSWEVWKLRFDDGTNCYLLRGQGSSDGWSCIPGPITAH